MGNSLRLKSASGMTLVELLLAIFILFLVFIPVLTISNSISKSLRTQDIIDSGYQLCSNLIETQIQKTYSEEVPEDKQYSSTYNNYIYNISERVHTQGDLRMLEVEVNHPQLKQPIKLYRIL